MNMDGLYELTPLQLICQVFIQTSSFGLLRSLSLFLSLYVLIGNVNSDNFCVGRKFSADGMGLNLKNP